MVNRNSDRPGLTLFIACYESGHQPLSLAWPLAFLQRAGLDSCTLDLSRQPFEDGLAAQASFVGIAVPMHTAMRLGLEAARRVRAINPQAHLCFFGLYAWLNEDYLLDEIADSVIAGEYEAPLVELIRAIRSGDRHPAQIAGVSIPGARARPVLSRLPFPVPARSQLEPLDRYARYDCAGRLSIAGYVEASRGCLHTCRHCPIVPVYGGRFFVVPLETVLADIRQQVGAGARHITFGDPDFLNGPGHALQVARSLHREFPDVSFDFTAKVEHILKHRRLFPEFAALGCTFVVSAIESLSDRVLGRLAKGHTARDVHEALEVLDSAGIAMQPTLVAFTPWTTLDDYLGLLDFVQEHDLARHVPPIQLSVRLLVPPRSALLADPDNAGLFAEPDPAAFTYRWRHPDPRMDRLQREVSRLVELATAAQQSPEDTHRQIRELACAIAGRPAPPAPVRVRARPRPPRLTEDWFC
jgi:hypothetical protein